MEAERRNAASPTKIRSDEEVETLQLTKKEKKSSLSSQDENQEKPSNGHCGNAADEQDQKTEPEKEVASNEETTNNDAEVPPAVEAAAE